MRTWPHASLHLGPPRGCHHDRKAVVGGEGQRLGVQGHLHVAAHVALDDGLGAVVEDGRGHATEVGKGRQVTGPERDEVLARDVAAERVTAVGESHGEAVDVEGAVLGVDHPLVAPVHLGLGPGQHREAPVQVGLLRTDPRAGLGEIHLHALVAVGEAVLGNQALVDHRARETRLLVQPPVDVLGVGLDHLGRVGPPPHRRRRTRGGCGQVLLRGAVVTARLAGDLRPARTSRLQRPQCSNIHPVAERATWKGHPPRVLVGPNTEEDGTFWGPTERGRPTHQPVRGATYQGVRGQ